MPRNKTEGNEVQTTLRIDSELHFWYRRYALESRTTFTNVVESILRTWAEEHGFRNDKGENTSPTTTEKGK